MLLRSIAEARSALRTLSSQTTPVQTALVCGFPSIVGGRGSLESVRAALAPFREAPEDDPVLHEIHRELDRLLKCSPAIGRGSLVHLVGPRRSLGIGLMLINEEEPKVILPAPFHETSVGMDAVSLSRSPFPVVTLKGRGQTDQRREAIQRIRRAIEGHAPRGSPFRKELIQDLRHALTAIHHTPGTPLTLEIFVKAVERLNYLLRQLLSSLASDPRRINSEPQTYRVFCRKLISFLLEIDSPAIPLFKKEERELLGKTCALIEGLPSGWRLSRPDPDLLAPALEEFLAGPSDPRLGNLRTLLALEIFRIKQRHNLNKMRIAVVGYGTNLDTIAFFLSLGFDVTAIEKGRLDEVTEDHLKPSYAASGDLFLRAIDFPELSEASGSWIRFAPQEILRALGNPKKLHFYDSDSDDLPKGTFDLVVMSAIVDEALPTIAILPKVGGFVLAEYFAYPSSFKTARAQTFIRCAQEEYGVSFETLFNEAFAVDQRVLPTHFLSDPHIVYLLKRTAYSRQPW